MVDPYLLLQYRSMSWVPQFVGELAISESFFRALESDADGLEADMYRSVWPYPQQSRAVFDLRGPLLTTLRDAERFSAGEVELAESDRDIANALADQRGWYARIIADEWAFLQSRSAMAASRRRALDLLRDAGVAVIEHGRRMRDRFVQMVAPGELPPVLTAGFLAKVSVKWLVVGGVTAGGAAGGSLGGPAVSAVAGMAGLASVPFVQAFDL